MNSVTSGPAPASPPGAVVRALESAVPQLQTAIRATLAGPSRAGAATSQPEVSDAAIREATGRGWEEWVRVLDADLPALGGTEATHTQIARHVASEYRVQDWWAQGVTVGYERLTGRRLPGQMPDGTFTVQRNRTVRLGRDTARAWILNDGARHVLLPGLGSALRSKPAAKQLRIGLSVLLTGQPLGIAGFATDEAKPDPTDGAGRIRLNITHDKLPSAGAGEAWKSYWGAWLDALALGLAQNR